ncbi:PLP-dependent aminotransferase family protein [Massilia arenosa]|uniref:PLP-dependent aminotransferase family protein n=1 Tax=Zemynaea arenosa TaxID=2561931 RepID=A0A4Y9SGF0_9BURK|nr:PLP-dependent aminotransferase family protein [Massilia arenosa]
MSQTKSIQEATAKHPWLAGVDAGSGPRYLRIAEAIEQALFDGILKPGDRLPPQRELASDLGMDLTTVTRAYDEAKRRHLLEGKGARGTFVATPRIELAQVLDLSMNIPPPPAGLRFDELLKQGLTQVLLRADTEMLMAYHLGGGSQTDRTAGAAWLEPMLGRLHPDHVIVCPGAQAALAALLLTHTAPGEVVLAEAVNYPGLRAAAAQFGRTLVTVEADADGMLPDALERACREHGARLLYLNPTLQNPTTATMPSERRQQIAGVALRCGLHIIEDDPYWRFADHAPPPLALAAPDHVSYVSTLSKCLTPGLRVAFVVIRAQEQRSRFLAALRSFALMAPPLTATLATQWILDGTAQQLFTGVRDEARARHALAAELLAGREASAAQGLHIWLPLPGYWSSTELARAAAGEGLAVTPSEVFTLGGPLPNAIRISLGSTPDSKRLAAGLRRLSQLLARAPQSFSHQVI